MYLYLERVVKFVCTSVYIYQYLYECHMQSMQFVHLRCICVQPRFLVGLLYLSFMCSVLQIIICNVVLFFWPLSVLRYRASDYHFNVFKVFLTFVFFLLTTVLSVLRFKFSSYHPPFVSSSFSSYYSTVCIICFVLSYCVSLRFEFRAVMSVTNSA